jgi:hypothetical protein
VIITALPRNFFEIHIFRLYNIPEKSGMLQGARTIFQRPRQRFRHRRSRLLRQGKRPSCAVREGADRRARGASAKGCQDEAEPEPVPGAAVAATSVTRILLGGAVSCIRHVSNTDTPWIRFQPYPKRSDTYRLGYSYRIRLGHGPKH